MKTLAIASLLLILSTTYVHGQEGHVAFFKNVSGEIEIIRGKQQLAASTGMQLLRSDKVVSGPGAAGGIIFTDGTLLSVGPGTEIDILEYTYQPSNKQYDFSLYMKQGRVVYSTGRLGKRAPKAVQLKTPRATLGVRGTRFIVLVD